MEPWEAVMSLDVYRDYMVRKIDVPDYREDEHIRCIGHCEENLCGEYGHTWACPPDMDIDPSELYSSTAYALLVRRTFCLDVKDEELVKATSVEMQKIMRMMVTDLRRNNMDCIGFADGGCNYCGVCARPEPCRFPEMLVRSISALGLDVGRFLSDNGIDFSFSGDCITLYGLIFIRG